MYVLCHFVKFIHLPQTHRKVGLVFISSLEFNLKNNNNSYHWDSIMVIWYN